MKSPSFLCLLLFSCFPLSFCQMVHNNLGRKWQPSFSHAVHELPDSCREEWMEQVIDHFGWDTPPGNSLTFRQRFIVCDKYWELKSTAGRTNPIFFYFGNEANVELYVNMTGLMWQAAEIHSGLLVFAEHRYYGKSLPFGPKKPTPMNYLSTEQALADFATIIVTLKQNYSASAAPVVGWGGSYGGMLATWFRLKYPHLVIGVLTGSAPVASFLGQSPPYDQESYAQVVSADASPRCQNAVRSAWDPLFSLAETDKGRKELSAAFRTCKELESPADAQALPPWILNAFSFLAMGDYPFPSAYMTNLGCELPAWPMNVACQFMTCKVGEVVHSFTRVQEVEHNDTTQLLSSLRDAVGVFYNCSGTLTCFDLSASVNNDTLDDDSMWDYQWCTELFQPTSSNGEDDMFWANPFDEKAASDGCFARWGVRPRPYWATTDYGGPQLVKLSNIIFSNGDLDPWIGGGITVGDPPHEATALVIENAAHHQDFFWPNDADPKSVIDARETELRIVKQWLDDYCD